MAKKVTIEQIQKLGFSTYEEEVAYIQKEIAAGRLRPIKSSPSNDRNPPLKTKYWQESEVKKDYTQELRSLHYRLDPTHYLSNQKDYEKVRDYVLALNRYLSTPHDERPMSKREGSYEIFGYEKVFEKNKILENLGLTLADLHLYDTAEPIAFYTRARQSLSKALIVENSDPYFTIRDLLVAGQESLLSEGFDTIIYGGGKRIESSFKAARLSFLPYDSAHCTFYYWGDLDYEGLSIFYHMAKTYHIKPFEAMYRLMLKKGEGRPLVAMPAKQKKPNDEVYTYFSPDLAEAILALLHKGVYIPQEIINRRDLSNE
jgi:hypothetical protein